MVASYNRSMYRNNIKGLNDILSRVGREIYSCIKTNVAKMEKDDLHTTLSGGFMEREWLIHNNTNVTSTRGTENGFVTYINRRQCWTKAMNGGYHKIMGYNFKNARNGKSMSKTSKWPSLMPLALKSEISFCVHCFCRNVLGSRALNKFYLFIYLFRLYCHHVILTLTTIRDALEKTSNKYFLSFTQSLCLTVKIVLREKQPNIRQIQVLCWLKWGCIAFLFDV